MLIGWIGAIAFGLCGFPQALMAHKEGHAEGLSMACLALWTIGEICTIYAVSVDAPRPYLVSNYLANLLFLGVIWRYKLLPRK
jgi:uncharacterized protein with PQ loop repeat